MVSSGRWESSRGEHGYEWNEEGSTQRNARVILVLIDGHSLGLFLSGHQFLQRAPTAFSAPFRSTASRDHSGATEFARFGGPNVQVCNLDGNSCVVSGWSSIAASSHVASTGGRDIQAGVREKRQSRAKAREQNVSTLAQHVHARPVARLMCYSREP